MVCSRGVRRQAARAAPARRACGPTVEGGGIVVQPPVRDSPLRPGAALRRGRLPTLAPVPKPPVPLPKRQTPPSRPPRRAERWAVDAGDAALATLVIPADAQRERRFEIAVAMTVRVPAPTARRAGGPSTMWHELTVHANGEQQWQRRVPTHVEPGDDPGSASWDGLDLRFARVVPPGQALKITARVAMQGVQRRSLRVEADEDLPAGDPPAGSAPGRR